jgi:alpha-glucosidase
MNEPAIGNAPKSQMRFDRDGKNHDHERYHNQYGFLRARATDEGVIKAHPDLRSFVLSRSGFAGIQRYAANWTGDNPVTWGQFSINMPMNCNLGISGQPFTGSDIHSRGDDELFIRWYEYTAFYPFFRNHSGNYPWAHGEQVETCIRKSIEFRYRLLPYLYTAMMRATETAEPIMRPLVFDFQDDPNVTDVSDQFMFGENILVAPVITKGAVERNVYFPDGAWYEFGKPGAIEGRISRSVSAPLDECPVFVRAGAVIPTAHLVQSTAFYKPEEIILDVYSPLLDGDYVSCLHEDDGLTNTYLDGAFYRTVFTVKKENGTITLAGSTMGDGFPEFARKRFRVRFIGKEIKETVVENTGDDFTLVFEEK